MKKNRRKSKRNQEPTRGQQRTLRLAEVIERNLYELVVFEGLKAVDEMLEQDRERICGPAHAKGTAEGPQRWGQTEGRLVMAGRRVVIGKPRVRHQGKEVTLASWAQFADEDPLDERTLEQMVLGVSTRGYNRSVEPLPDELDPHGASKSAASRRFVATTQEKLDAWLNRDLSKLRLVVVMSDGIIVVEDQTVLVALGIDESGKKHPLFSTGAPLARASRLGIDESGKKHPLGLWSGATENSKVCGALLDSLIERRLDPLRPHLFVIDGSKALRKGIRDRFGGLALVQRCQQHKLRNVLGHLPKTMHTAVRTAMNEAQHSRSKSTAKKRLQQLASQLEEDHPDATASLKEGLHETLTLKDMRLPPSLEKTLSTTNPIENLNSTIRRVLRRVKRWRGGSMVKRWVAAGVLEAERGFRRLRGYKGLPTLVHALHIHAEQIHPIDDTKEVA